MDVLALLPRLQDADDPKVWCNSDNANTTVCVGERDGCLLDAACRDALLELQVVALTWEGLLELFGAQEGGKVFAATGVKQRI